MSEQATSKEVMVIRESVQKITRILANKDIRVTQRGAQAYVVHDSRTGKIESVNLPYIPDNASRELIAAIQGFLDHEVGHILFTDFDVIHAEKHRGAEFMSLLNIVEDTWIERAMEKKFAGSGANLDNVRRFFVERHTKPKYEEALKSGEQSQVIGKLMMPAMRAWAGHKPFEDFMADKWAAFVSISQVIGKDLADRFAGIKSTAEARDLAVDIKERMDKAKENASKSQQEQEGESSLGNGDESSDESGDPTGENEQGQDGSDEQGDDSEQEQEGEGSGDEEGDDSESEEGEDDSEEEESGDADESEPPDVPDQSDEEVEEEEEPEEKEQNEEPEEEEPEEKEQNEEPEEEEPEEEEPEEEEPEEEEPEEEESESDGSEDSAGGDENDSAGSDSSGEEDESEGESGGSDSDDDSEDESESEAGSSGDEEEEEDEDTSGDTYITRPEDISAAQEGAKSDDFDEGLATMLSNESTEDARVAPYIVYSTEWDRAEKFTYEKSEYRDHFLERLEDETRSMTGVLQKSLERLMIAKSQSRWMPGQRKGRVHAASLYRLKTKDTRVFRQRDTRESKNTAVSLVVDNSGSMRGPRMENAMIAAYALSNVLGRLDISNEVCGFTTHEGSMTRKDVDMLYREEARLGRLFSRREPIYQPIYKAFEERMTVEAKKRMAVASHIRFMQLNVDGESIQMAAKRLAQMKEEKKIMIVLSDGQPAASGDGESLKAHLRQTVADLTQKGFIMIGIGINSPAVKVYYPQYAILNDVSELPQLIMTELKEHLLGK